MTQPMPDVMHGCVFFVGRSFPPETAAVIRNEIGAKNSLKKSLVAWNLKQPFIWTIYKWLFQWDDSKSLHGKWLEITKHL